MQTVATLTQNSIIGEIDKVLDTYSYNPYQQAFAIPEIRQELIEYVLTIIPCVEHSLTPGRIKHRLDTVPASKIPLSPLQQQLYIQNIIHQGICTVMQAKAELISQILCETVRPACEPSHWFG